MVNKISAEMFTRAQRLIPGGVNSPVRSFTSVGSEPVFVSHGKGAYLYDVDGNSYIDYLMSWGAIILGHSHPEVLQAINNAAAKGCGFGLSTEVEGQLAEIIQQAFPSIELLRMVNSGTEAVMTAVRLARGYTGRNKIIKFAGCYHGHSDALLVKAGSGLATLSLPASNGIPEAVTADTLSARYNDLESVEALCQRYNDEIACILVEPVAGNMGVVAPAEGFLEGLRELCNRIGALLIFDEVITGFRIAWGGAQERFGINADLTTLGKIIGGGLPVGAVGGRREVMKLLAPLGDVYQAGTLAGNPVVLSAGRAVLEILRRDNPYPQLEKNTTKLAEAVKQTALELSIPLEIGQVAGMFTIFFSDQQVIDYPSAQAADTGKYGRFFQAMLEKGVLLPPSQWETAFFSPSHQQGNLLKKTMASAIDSLKALAE